MDRIRESENLITVILAVYGLAVISMLYYYDVIESFVRLLFIEEYSYIMVVIFSVVVLYVLGFKDIRGIYRLRLSRLLSFIALVFSSMVTYVLGLISNEYMMELKLLSLVLLSWAFIVMLFESGSLKSLLIPMLATLAIIPVPKRLMDSVAVHLSEATARLIALTGFDLIQAGNRLFLRAVDPTGAPILLEIISVCSGIVSLASVVATVPILLYFAGKSGVGWTRKLIALIAAAGLGNLVAFLGNLIRIYLVVKGVELWGAEYSLRLFHSNPSIIYAALAIVVEFYVLTKILGKGENGNVVPERSGQLVSRPYAVWVFFTIFVAIIVVAYPLVLGVQASQGVVGGRSIVYSFEDLVMDTSSIVFNNSQVDVAGESKLPALVRALGSSIVKSVGLNYNGTAYTGYIEVAETPTRFHDWVVCLTLQGYRIERTWTYYGNKSTVSFILFHGLGGDRMLLAYTVYEVPTYFGGGVETAYVRVSIFKMVSSDVEADAIAMSRALEASAFGKSGSKALSSIKYLLLGSSITILATLVYYGVNMLVRFGILRFRRFRGVGTPKM